ncbi:MAG: sugar kinase [Hyphomicrobiaceae bacterium]|nr:sugar kinase [Hyphomicrobiaceae bacterium]MCC0022643.1 sugar kinase [Hyphomicrobiaceae bacterium]
MRRLVSIGECMIEMSGGTGGEYRMGFAGDTLNAAYYARAGLGGDWQVDYLSAVGDDLYSGQMRNFLQSRRIGTAHVKTIPGKRPGLYLIHQADGDRHFTYWRDSSAARLLADDPAALDAGLAGAELVYFSGISLAILSEPARNSLYEALKRARDAGAKIAFDPNVRPALWMDMEAMKAEIARAATHCDFAFPTLSDEKGLFGDADAEACAARYRDWGAGEVVVRNGAANALVASDGGEVSVPAEKVPYPIDPTGAGDSFSGAYLAARLSGSTAEAAAKRAHKVASIVIQHPGALVPLDLF